MVDVFLDMAADSSVSVLSGTHSIFRNGTKKLTSCIKGVCPIFFLLFFKLSEILILKENSYFSHYLQHYKKFYS